MSEDRQRTPSDPPPRPRSESEAFDRLQSLEVRLMVYEERTERRLDHGASKFAEHDAALGDLRPKRQSWLSAAGFALAVGGIVFGAGRYPDRAELERSRDAVTEEVGGLRGDLVRLERELVRARTMLEALERRVEDVRAELGRLELAARGR